jgi:hypothetical protein
MAVVVEGEFVELEVEAKLSMTEDEGWESSVIDCVGARIVDPSSSCLALIFPCLLLPTPYPFPWTCIKQYPNQSNPPNRISLVFVNVCAVRMCEI